MDLPSCILRIPLGWMQDKNPENRSVGTISYFSVNSALSIK
jgi:hypothetical protein